MRPILLGIETSQPLRPVMPSLSLEEVFLLYLKAEWLHSQTLNDFVISPQVIHV